MVVPGSFLDLLPDGVIDAFPVSHEGRAGGGRCRPAGLLVATACRCDDDGDKNNWKQESRFRSLQVTACDPWSQTAGPLGKAIFKRQPPCKAIWSCSGDLQVDSCVAST